MLEVFHSIALGFALVAGVFHPAHGHSRQPEVVTQARAAAPEPAVDAAQGGTVAPVADFERRAAGVSRFDAMAIALRAERIVAARARARAAAAAAASLAQARVPIASPPVRVAVPAGSGSIRQIIAAAFSPLGAGAVTWAERVAMCESGDNPAAVSPSGYLGLFQFARSTWNGTPYAASSPFDAVANARAAAWLYAHDGPAPWGCR